MNKFFLFIAVLIPTAFFSQNLEYGKTVIDTLTSSYFSGRGALDNGEQKAAEFIAKEFEKQGLNSYDNNYFQEFLSPINVFPGKIKLEIDGKLLKAGKDYLVNPTSKGVKGSFDVIWYDSKTIPSEKRLKKLAFRNYFNNKFIIIDDEGVDKSDPIFRLLKVNYFNAAGIIFLKNKLTHSLSKKRNDFASLQILREEIDKSIEKISININQKFLGDYKSQNVIGFVKGSEHPDSIIILSAHYDHLGKLGDDVFFPGANDNASGVALLLDLAYHYTHKYPPTKTVVFIAFGAEEIGLVGSQYFVQNPPFDLKKINFVFNMDLMGTGSEGAMIVNGKIFENQYKSLTKINEEHNYLPIIKKRGKAANSDHYWFSENGVPAFFIYLMGGIKAYHDIYDVSETLPLTKFEDTFRLIRDFVDEL
jgi:aminopeptidase YwaD